MKVPQHVQDAKCPEESKLPLTSQKCEAPKQLAAETCSDGIKNQNEEGIDCGGICKLCEEKNLSTQNVKQKEETGLLTGFSIKDLFEKTPNLAIASLAALILVAFAGIKLYRKSKL